MMFVVDGDWMTLGHTIILDLLPTLLFIQKPWEMVMLFQHVWGLKSLGKELQMSFLQEAVGMMPMLWQHPWLH